MARKSRDTIWRERLAHVSGCPSDIFDLLPVSEELISRASLIESCDPISISYLLSLLHTALTNEAVLDEVRIHGNEAVAYLIKKATSTRERSTAKLALDLMYKTAIGLEFSDLIHSILSEDKEQSRKLSAVTVMRIILGAAEGRSYTQLLPLLTRLETNTSPDVWLYAFSMTKGIGPANSLCRDYSEKLGIPLLPSLSSFGRVEGKAEVSEEKAREYVCRCLEIGKEQFLLDYRGFWLRCAYEICAEYLRGDFSLIAKEAFEFSKGSVFCEKKNLYTLVWAQYLLSLSLSPEQQQATEATVRGLTNLVHFNYQMPSPFTEEIRKELMRDAVYTYYSKEKADFKKREALGFIICHARNRYNLSATLEGHTKRGRKHYWESTFSIELSGESAELPLEFAPLSVVVTNNVATRGGARLPYDKTTSQVICTSEITVNGINHPLEIDLILDIAYISSVKCGNGDIYIKEVNFKDGYAVMSCQIYLY